MQMAEHTQMHARTASDHLHIGLRFLCLHGTHVSDLCADECILLPQEFIYQQPCDWFTNTNKLKRAGFNKMDLVRHPDPNPDPVSDGDRDPDTATRTCSSLKPVACIEPARRTAWQDTEDMWVRKLHQLAADGIIPNYPRLPKAGEYSAVA